MTSSSPSARPVLLRRDAERDGLASARLDQDLRHPGLAEHSADPRLVDASLELAFDEAVGRAVEAGVRRGYARGHEAGTAAGLAEARAQALAEQQARAAHQLQQDAAVARTLAALADAAESLRATRAEALTCDSHVLVAAALELAEALVGHDVAARTHPGADALERALAALPDSRGTVTARLHPEDVAALSASTGEGVQLVPDASVERGGCVVQAGDAEVDSQVRAGLERVRAVLAA